jgi:hypothetical protein
VHDHLADRGLAAADRDRHRQRGLRQVGVVVLTDREPDDPARPHVQHAVQVELALLGRELGAVAVPLAVQLVAAKFRPIRSGADGAPWGGGL